MKNILPFSGCDRSEIESFGGKGQNLAILTQAGFPVPPGVVVRASCYDWWLQDSSFSVRELRFSYEDPERLRAECEELRNSLSKVPFPSDLQAELLSALESFPVDSSFAVRSSSTFEDLGEAAFAGQHDTYLNCKGIEEITRKIRDCWQSLWTDRAVLYRHRRGFPHELAAMAVVVQVQIPSQISGVAFSINPVSGDLQSVVIDANYGLGESVVSGEYEVDHFEIDAQTWKLQSQFIAEKCRCIVTDTQGTKEIEVAHSLQTAPCLNEEQIIEVAQLSRAVQEHYSWPQDIEWGIAEGKLYLLQARPVTSIPPRWTRDESAERWPRAITPLSWDYIDAAFRKSLKHSLELMQLPPMQSNWFERLGYHVYGNQNAVQLIQAYRPFRAKTMEELEKEIPRLRESYASLIELPTLWMQNLDQYLLQIGALKAVDLNPLSEIEVWMHLEAVAKVAEEYFQPNIAISMTQSFLHGILHRLMRIATNEELALQLVDGLLSGIDCKTVEVNKELWELSQLSFEQVNFRNELDATRSQDFLEKNRISVFPEFNRMFARFLDRHGHRELFMDYSYPTWSDAPDLVLDLIRAIPRDAEIPTRKIRSARQRYSETEFQVLSRTPENLRFFFKELIRLARVYTSLDDLEHYQTTRVNPLARRGALHLGGLLVGRGALGKADDIFFFRRDELKSLIQSDGSSIEEFRALAQKRREEFAKAELQGPAWVYGQVETESPSDGQLKGIPGSPGSVEGSCFLISDGEQFRDFPEGAILVAKTTNPAWTPLFYRAVGLITESGGPLSHGAVTAREMRLPAVMAVRDVMKTLQNGQRVKVNGTNGTVELC